MPIACAWRLSSCRDKLAHSETHALVQARDGDSRNSKNVARLLLWELATDWQPVVRRANEDESSKKNHSGG